MTPRSQNFRLCEPIKGFLPIHFVYKIGSIKRVSVTRFSTLFFMILTHLDHAQVFSTMFSTSRIYLHEQKSPRCHSNRGSSEHMFGGFLWKLLRNTVHDTKESQTSTPKNNRVRAEHVLSCLLPTDGKEMWLKMFSSVSYALAGRSCDRKSSLLSPSLWPEGVVTEKVLTCLLPLGIVTEKVLSCHLPPW